MAPQPKRRHSHGRTGRRRASAKHQQSLPKAQSCPRCHQPKLRQVSCSNCGFY